MDKLTNYRQYIQKFLQEQTQDQTIGGDIETEVIFDLNRDRYLLIDMMKFVLFLPVKLPEKNADNMRENR